MKFPSFTLRFFLILTLGLSGVCGAAIRNVVFIFSDDQRADTIHALGNPNIETPHLDSLVKCGTSFTRAHCMGGLQGAVCVPSRAMLMTGRSLWRIHEQMKGQATWPEQFVKNGYSAFITGKWHNGKESLLRSFPAGGAIFMGGMGDPWDLQLQDIASDHTLRPRPKAAGRHAVEEIANSAIQFLEQRPADKPFLLYVAMEAPHDPRIAPPAFHEKYKAKLPPLPPDFRPQHPFDNGEMTVRDEKLAPWPRTPDNIRSQLADYYALITFMDSQIGRILAAIEKSGAAKETLIVFASDQGLALGSHGLMGKQNLYESGMTVPLIFCGPGLSGDVRRDGLCYLIDVFATIGDLTGIKPPDGCEGHSLASQIRGEQPAGRPFLLTAYRNVQRAITDGRWKLIRYPEVNVTQLFDLQSDPHEMTDLFARPDMAAKRQELLAEMQRQQAVHGDRCPLEVPNPRPAAWSPPRD